MDYVCGLQQYSHTVVVYLQGVLLVLETVRVDTKFRPNRMEMSMTVTQQTLTYPESTGPTTKKEDNVFQVPYSQLSLAVLRAA